MSANVLTLPDDHANRFAIRVTGMRRTSETRKARAHADVEIDLGNGAGCLKIFGFSVIEENGKKPWVGYPARRGDSRWFAVVRAEGPLNELVCNAVLDAYARVK